MADPNLTIEVGDSIPQFTFFTAQIEKPSKCSDKHLPGYLGKLDQLRAKGVDEVCCIAVNDAFVLAHWAEHLNATGKIKMLADGSGNFTKLVGMSLDLIEKGMGVRAKRYAMVVANGIVKYLGIDESGLAASKAETVLEYLSMNGQSNGPRVNSNDSSSIAGLSQPSARE